jgi:hypothetical protein
MNVRMVYPVRAILPALLSLAFIAGCTSPTHTAGTTGLAVKDLSTLAIPQLPKDAHLQIHTIQFDGDGEEYKIGKGREFYLKPSDHTASFTFKASIPNVSGVPGWLMPKGDVTLPGPKNVPLGALMPGKTYELAAPNDFDKMLQTGELSMVREKGK